MSKALVLNATYEPLSVVPTRRALVLVWLGRATLVAAREETWESERETFDVPSVVKLNRYVKVPYRRAVPLSRRTVFGRDRGECQYCGAAADSLDHVIPRSRGGGHTWDNVVACCRRCNSRKGNRLVSEVGYSLTSPPRPPKRHGWVTARNSVDPSWRPYLLAG